MFSKHRKQLPDNDVRELDVQQPLRREEFPRSKYWQQHSEKRARRIFVTDTIPNGSVFGATTTRLGQSDREFDRLESPTKRKHKHRCHGS